MYKLFINLIFLLAVGSLAKNHLDECITDNECSGNLNCYTDRRYVIEKPDSGAYKCRCTFGQIYSPARNSCQPMESTACQNDTQCQDRDLKRNCNQTSNRCECSSGQSPDQLTSKCLSQRHSPCQVDDDCPSNLECYQRTKTCLCPPNYLWDQSQDECRPMFYFSCTNDDDCQDRDRYRICANDTKFCVCRSGYYYDYYFFANKVCSANCVRPAVTMNVLAISSVKNLKIKSIDVNASAIKSGRRKRRAV